MTHALRRVALWVGLFALLPALVASAAALVTARPQVWLALAIARQVPAASSRILAQALLAACAWSALLGLASLWAWPRGGPAAHAGAARMAGAALIVSIVLYPGFAAFLPPLTWMPWWLGVALACAGWLLTCAPRPLRPGGRELLLTAAALAVFFANPRGCAPDLRAVAGRELTSRDVLLLGFDSVSEEDSADVIQAFSPSRGSKVVFTNAWTTVELTGGAWRSILSGKVPQPADLLPGSVWPAGGSPWLPRQLAAQGYRPTFLQDDPLTNVYRSGELLRVTDPQGWRAAITEFAWDVLFPLSTAGGRWWVGALGGPAMEPGEFAYCPRCFLDAAFTAMAEEARRGPVFWALHTCYAHDPLRLTLREVARLPGWWRLAPRAFVRADLQGRDGWGRSLAAAARVDSVKGLLRETLEFLDRAGVLGNAVVFVLSDHGPRGPRVPGAITGHVLLTAFLPGDRKDLVVREPVSLVDLAPTLAGLLGVELPRTDGVPLPLDGREPQVRRSRADLAPQENPVGELDVWRLSAGSIQGLLTFHPDGSYSIEPARFAATKAALAAARPR